jgi:erythromycin esterase-like protein
MRQHIILSVVYAFATVVLMSPVASLGQDVTEADFVDWVRTTAIQVDDWKMNPQLAEYLDRALGGKRIVYVGEPDHFFAEKHAVQIMLIRHLVGMGYRHIFHEGYGATMASQIDEFVRNGERPAAAEVGRQTDVERYRGAVFAGWVGAKESEFRGRTAASQNRFLETLHEMNKRLPSGDKIRIHPLDIDMVPGGCKLSIRAILASHQDNEQLDELRTLIARDENATPEQELERFERLRQIVDANQNSVLDSFSREERSAIARHADCLVETLAFFGTVREDGNMVRALVRREPAMYRQVKYAMESLPDDAKCVMIAHSNHLNKLGSDITRARQPSVGEMIYKDHPKEVFSIWMLFDHGMHLNPMAKQPLQPVKSDPDRVESLMARAGSAYILPLGTGDRDEGYLAAKRTHSYFSWSETSTISMHADAIVFIREISAPTAD